MAPYFVIFIATTAIPFLLYCLWHFMRETAPRTSSTHLSADSFRLRVLRAIRTPQPSRQENVGPQRRAGAARRPQVEC